jgi:UDP-N-acetylglucosamine diphosphorylase/glucosamine-1-phosphate N-acetyltransferase
MHIILFDDNVRYSLLPFTHTRPVADIRCGILTMRERWEQFLGQQSSTLTEEYLQPVFPLQSGDDNLLINGSVFANDKLAPAVQQLQVGQKLMHGEIVIAARLKEAPKFEDLHKALDGLTPVTYEAEIYQLKHLWDIFSLNEKALKGDYILVTGGKKSAAIPEGVTVTGKENLFIEEGAKIGAGSIINASTGPVYIGKDAEILEGTLIRGPLAMCNHSVLKMGAKIYGATTIGPGCKVGGEINNVVFFANSNKAHDGYLGNAVIGEWCNLGADTNCSNLKNNYDEVKIWDEHNNKSVKTGLTFCGLLMADHSKCAINTAFNTGTVVGVSSNIFGGGFPEKFVPSFCWGGSEGITTYAFERAMETMKRVMARRNIIPGEAVINMYRHIFDKTTQQRHLFAR